MYIFNLIQGRGGGILAIANIPQLWQIIKTKQVRDINTKTFVLLLIGFILMEIYVLYLVIGEGTAHMLLITHTTGLVIMLLLNIFILKYKWRDLCLTDVNYVNSKRGQHGTTKTTSA